jgi:hypothetical protein
LEYLDFIKTFKQIFYKIPSITPIDSLRFLPSDFLSFFCCFYIFQCILPQAVFFGDRKNPGIELTHVRLRFNTVRICMLQHYGNGKFTITPTQRQNCRHYAEAVVVGPFADNASAVPGDPSGEALVTELLSN